MGKEARGADGMTNVERDWFNAYRSMKHPNAAKAYKATHPNSNDMTCYKEGGIMLKRPAVRKALAKRRARVARKAELTREGVLKELADLRDGAAEANQFGPAVAAEKARGQEIGMFVERSAIEGAEGGPLVLVVKKRI